MCEPWCAWPLGRSLSLCWLLQALAVRTWRDIEDGERLGVALGEEAITDRLLLDLLRAAPNRIAVRKWSRWDEGRRSGADWDWWFVNGRHDRFVGLRVQAKRINYFHARFDHLDYRNTHGLQVDKLVSSARSDGLHPLYVTYLATHDDDRRSASRRPIELYGCSVMSASFASDRIRAGQRSLAELWHGLRPWSDLACGRERDLATRVDSAVRDLPAAGDDRDARAESVGAPSLVRDAAPDEVQWLMSGDEEPYTGRLPDVFGTVVIVDDADE